MQIFIRDQIAELCVHWEERIIKGLRKQMSWLRLARFVDTDLFPINWGAFTRKPIYHLIVPGERFTANPAINLVSYRSGKYYQFVPTLECVSRQCFDVVWSQRRDIVNIYVDGYLYLNFHLRKGLWKVTCYRKKNKRPLGLIIDSGYKSIKEFLSVYSTDFQGELIHWTTRSY
jgi:hypothetical protein